MRVARTGLLVGLLLTCGCSLVDQTTFNPRAADAPAIPVPAKAVPPPGGPPALVVIENPAARAYGESLARAVAAARARKADVVFDVVEIEPPDTAVPASEAAVEVARGIIAAGVRPDRVRLVARPEGGRPPGEIRVYVR